jgi:type II secretory pathway pseudopilin PulG
MDPMKRNFKSMLGVTLLEIMLVLAIAAMIIVMSIRYYQSASLNQKLNAAVDTITGIVAAGESYLSAYGTFSNITSGIKNYLPGGNIPTSPWGGALTITGGGATATSYTINGLNAPTGSGGCNQLQALLKNNSKLSVTCSAVVVNE